MLIDLRSDTVTKPTATMRQAMATAAVGDDVYGEDPTVIKLERQAAELLGKEKALFVPTGTMANQIGVLVHTTPGDEVLVEADSHIYYYELGGLARLGGVQSKTLIGKGSKLTPEQVEQAIRPKDIHFPPTRLLCLENTHNRGGGAVLTVEETTALAAVAGKHGLAVHLDGARIFNAAVALQVPTKDLVEPVDSLMFCLSKGLGAPIGSLLLGTEEFIHQARKWRKMLGGGMRQVGVIASCGIVALETMVDRLEEDHQLARKLAASLAALPGIELDIATVETNIVVARVKPETGLTAPELVAKLAQAGVGSNSFGPDSIRFVTHADVNEAQVEQAVEIIARLLQEQ